MKKKKPTSSAIGCGNGNKPLHEVTFCTEESQEESKDEESSNDVIVTPKNMTEFIITPKNNTEDIITPKNMTEDAYMQDSDTERRDSLMFTSFKNEPNQLMLRRRNSSVSNMSYRSSMLSNS